MSDNVLRPEFGSVGASSPAIAGAEQVAGSGDGGPPFRPDLIARITAVEATLERLIPLIVRLDERSLHLATKDDVAAVRIELAGKASHGTVWAMGATLFTLVLAAAALGAVYMPYLATLLRRAGQ